ncbi:MAG TPA: metal-sulfur cluster assembly factor, partial [Planctomycetota bacterium]|nr:metal-sulfur cluster assembly factor [Planctomycetota bacterium]
RPQPRRDLPEQAMMSLDPTTLALENALYDVEDPEMGLNLVDLGLIRGVRFDATTGVAEVTMTLTTRTCPAGETLVEGVKRRLLRVRGVTRVEVETTFDPPWSPEEISPAGRAQLGWG